MSLFGTLRKKGKKVPPSPLSKSPIFSSTPNLNVVSMPPAASSSKSNNGVGTTSVPLSKSQHFSKEFNSGSELSKNDGNLPTTTTIVVHAAERGSGAGGGGEGMKNFMSLVSMASSLKRLKKQDKKKMVASASNLHRIEPDRREAVIFEDSAAAASQRLGNNVNMLKAIKSAPILDLPNPKSVRSAVCDGDEDEPQGSNNNNTEPGVISSSSSTSSCNQSDTGSISSYNASSLPRSTRGGFSTSTSSLAFGSHKRSKRKNDGSTNEDPAFETSVNTKYVQDINRTQLMLQGAKKFNMEPKRGIDFLVLNGIIERTPEDVARFLKDGEGLSKTAIGNYLGEYIEFNLAVLQAFVDLHDFTDVLLVQALRQFLWSFRLPGESQKIDRMMESFAKRYCQLNPNLFKDSDTCYLLSFAIIMLNTSLHNPNVKTKTTLEQFIRMTDSEEKDRPFITSLYSSILEEPFKIPQEDGNDFVLTFFNPDIEGWLWKQGGHYKSWKRRWFILSNNCLYYFHYTTDRVPRGIIPLENIVAKPYPSTATFGSKHQYCFILQKNQTFDNPHIRVTDYIKSCKTLSDGQTIPGKHLTYTLATNTEAERERWVTAISQNSSSHDFYTLLAHKKNRIQALHQKSPANSSTKRGTMTIGRTKKSHSANSKSVRKSQISLPLTTAVSSTSLAKSPSSTTDPLNDSSTVEYNYYNYLVHPEKNPHNYFLTLPSTKSKALSLSNESLSARSNNSNSASGHNSGAEGEHVSSSEDESGEDDDGIRGATFTAFGRPELEAKSTLNEDASKRVTLTASHDEEETTTSASDFLIKKYSLPSQESTSAILKRYDSIITPAKIWSEQARDVEDYFRASTQLHDQMDGHEQAESPSICITCARDEGEDHRIIPITLETDQDLVCALPQEGQEQGEEQIPCQIGQIHDSNDSDSDEVPVPNKRSIYRKETSLDRHVEAILEKQKRCISSDLETTKSKHDYDDEESEYADPTKAIERTIERVTSFSKSIITTTTVVTSVRHSTNSTSTPSMTHTTLDSSDEVLHVVPGPSSSDILIDYNTDDEDYGRQIIHRNPDTSMSDSNSGLVESFNSFVIGNVRHTEV